VAGGKPAFADKDEIGKADQSPETSCIVKRDGSAADAFYWKDFCEGLSAA
jgi:hypothetical protein